LKLPRDLSGPEFARLLRRYEYEATRQVGSHIRLTPTTVALNITSRFPRTKSSDLVLWFASFPRLRLTWNCLAPIWSTNFSAETELKINMST
jgi:hypothetical protein